MTQASTVSVNEGDNKDFGCEREATDYLWFNCTENDECRTIKGSERIGLGSKLRINDITESDKNRYK